jgi:hypothetical protein
MVKWFLVSKIVNGDLGGKLMLFYNMDEKDLNFENSVKNVKSTVR